MGVMMPMVMTMLINLLYTILAIVLAVIAIRYIDLKYFKNLNFEEEIKKGNLAAAILLGALILFIALVVSSGLSG